MVDNWLSEQPKKRYPSKLVTCFEDVEWIKKNSGGDYHENEYLQKIFSNSQQQSAPKLKNAF